VLITSPGLVVGISRTAGLDVGIELSVVGAVRSSGVWRRGSTEQRPVKLITHLLLTHATQLSAGASTGWRLLERTAPQLTRCTNDSRHTVRFCRPHTIMHIIVYSTFSSNKKLTNATSDDAAGMKYIKKYANMCKKRIVVCSKVKIDSNEV